ncbi:glycosyltransferase [Enterobacteriaceae bacterium H20N1]|uniref:Glycosyltransferase n=1 Tax=Dryocola boscaweniae TaxID=2925397 RepID=A0A9X3AM48_9ENTR|nr:glycosyltransferase [Dryocola boscaweniae]MCT4700822.1 glycosyltransferase [Dryocola boscaweniae]MCT4717973.1 glycosyltransferase [Dryocola boscaweniae]
MTQQRRKILLLDNGKEWGGGTNSMLELLKRIDRQRFDITCCFYYNYARGEGETIEQVLNGIGIPVIFLPQTGQPLWAKISKETARAFVFFSRSMRKKVAEVIDKQWRINPNAKRIRDLLQRDGYQILYMNNQPGSNMEGYLAAFDLEVAVVQHCRIEPVMTEQITQTVNQTAQAVIAVSHGVERVLIQNGVHKSLCTTVSNAIDIHQPLPDGKAMREELELDENTFVFGSIGSLIPRKSCHHTLEALHRFHQQHPEAKWKFLLVGEGPDRDKLQQQANGYGFADRVIFTGFRNNPLDYLAAFDAFILASKSEGLPRVVLESMLLRTVVIGSNVTGTEELIDSGRTGLLYPYGDVLALAAHLQAVWQDSALRDVLTQQAHQRVIDNYAIEHYVAGVENVLGAVKPNRNNHV